MIVISIDPSINFTGFAIHDNSTLLVNTLLKPNKNDEDYFQKSKSIYSQIKGIVDGIKEENNEYVVVLETPEYWKVAGHAARESGSVFKLTFLCGMLGTLDNLVITTPSGWKGQLNKDAVNIRLRSVYPEINIEKLNHNIVDAIGIGNWFIDKKLKDYICQDQK